MYKNLLKLFIGAITLSSLALPKVSQAQVVPQKYYQASNNGAANAVFNSNYHTRMQQLYLPTDFNATPTPTYITKIYFKAAGNRSNAVFNDFVVRLGTTTAATLTNAAWTLTGLDTVFYRASHTFAQVTGNQWFEIELDEPYYWNGTSNLLVDFAQSSYTNGFALQFNNPGGSPAPRSKYGPQAGPVFVDNFPPVFFGYDGCVKPTIDLGNDTTFCDGNSITLDAGIQNSPIRWNTNDTTQTINTGTAGIYKVTVGSGVCSNSDSIKITIKDLPKADDINFIYNGQLRYSFQAMNPQHVSSYLWDFGDGATASGPSATHFYANSGQKNIRLIIRNECGVDTLFSKVYVPVSVQEMEINELVSVYPNPAHHNISIKSSQNDIKLEFAEIYNALGQKISSHNLEQSTQQINISHLPTGFYLISLATNKGMVHKKINVIH